MNKRYLLSLLFVMLLPAVLFAELIAGCNFDGDDEADVVRTSKCKSTGSVSIGGPRLLCRVVTIRLSSADGDYRQQIDFKDNKKKSDRRFDGFVCEDRDEDGVSELYANNLRLEQKRIRGIRTEAPDGIESVCNSSRELRSCEIWKSEASDHIPSSDPRANSTSFIARRGCPGTYPGCISVYDGNGTLVHKLGEYPNFFSDYDSRHYGGSGCGDRQTPSSLAAEARRNTGSPEVYLKDSAGVCVRIPDPSRCFNSSGC